MIGVETADKSIREDLPYTEFNIPTPNLDMNPPAYWWDRVADQCLFVGVYKHGYEKFNQIRADPSLCFLSRCGPPDKNAIAAELIDDNNDDIK